MPGRPKSTASESPMLPLRCRPTTNATEDKWTSKCPPTVARTLSLGGSGLWGMVRSLPELEKAPMSQNTWSPSTFHQTTQPDPPPHSPTGSSNSSKLGEEPTTPWLRRPVALNTPQPLLRWNDTAATTYAVLSSKWHDEQSRPTSTKKTTCSRGLNIVWKHTGSMNTSPPSKAAWTYT